MTSSEYECVLRYREKKALWNSQVLTSQQRDVLRAAGECLNAARLRFKDAADIFDSDMGVNNSLHLNYMQLCTQ